MNIKSSENLKPELDQNLESSGITKVSLLYKSLETSNEPSSTRKKYFIPFVQERDHLGRLLKETEEDIGMLENNSISPKPINRSGLKMNRNVSYSVDKLPPIRDHGKGSLHKLVVNSLQQSNYNEEVILLPTTGTNYTKFQTNLYRIGPNPDKSLEILGTSPRTDSEFIGCSQPDISKNLGNNNTLITEYELPSVVKKHRKTLPPLNTHHIEYSSIQPSCSVSAKSGAIPTVSDVRESDYLHLISEPSSLLNPTIWRYEASQIAQNKEVQKMLERESEKAKRAHLKRLLIPQNHSVIPPVGAYEPSLDFVMKRPKNCVILPEQSHVIKGFKLPLEVDISTKIRSIAKKALTQGDENPANANNGASSSRRTQNVENEKQKKARMEEHKQKMLKAKKLDYVILESFSRFPTDFESKINDMKLRLRVVKDKITNKEQS